MKKISYILTFVILTSCGQSKSKQKTRTVSDTATTENNVKIQDNSVEESQSEDDYQKESLRGFEKATLYKLTDTIIADLNGDGIIDKAFYKKENGTSGIIIKHGKTNEEYRIGFGKPFVLLNDFNLIDYWGLVKDKETNETTFKEDGDVLGSKEVKLQNSSIFVGRDEEGGGLITFRNGKYEWIHQAD